MQEKSLSAAQLAAIAGVNPSAVSHILSGRNFPGYDFITRVMEKYPEYNPRWLLLGTGPMKTPINPNAFEPKQNELPLNLIYQEGSRMIPDDSSNHNPPKKKIERIIVIYDDNTFELIEHV